MKSRPRILITFEDHVTNLNLQWQMLRDLYGSESNLKVLENAGPNFWATLEIYLVDHMLSAISRFFDPAKSKSQDNLSIERIIRLPELDPLRIGLNVKFDELKKTWEKGIKTWRHKKLSHSDIEYSLGAKKLPEIPIDDIDQIVKGISEIAHKIHLEIFDMDNCYSVITSRWVPEVINKLKAGTEHYEKN